MRLRQNNEAVNTLSLWNEIKCISDKLCNWKVENPFHYQIDNKANPKEDKFLNIYWLLGTEWMCSPTPPKIHRLKINPCDGLEVGSLGADSGLLIIGIKALKEARELVSSLSFYHVKRQEEWAIYNPEEISYQNPTIMAPWFELPASRTMTNKFVLLTRHPVMVFQYRSPSWLGRQWRIILFCLRHKQNSSLF